MARFEETFPPYHPFGSRNLSFGSAGTDVAVIQAVYDLMLKTMNPSQGPIGSPIAITGRFGLGTQAVVKAIQTYFNLSADGIVGPNTFFVFGQGVGPHTTYGGPVYGSRQLQQGDGGGDVTILQNRLNLFRYATRIGHAANGTFDAGTAAAVLAFKHDAESNGDTGLADNAIAGNGFFDATWLYTFAGGRALESGRNGFDVVFVQVLLNQLRFYSGRFDGVYGATTIAAVRAFQTSVGITVDGVVGPQTYYQLGQANAAPAPQPLGIAWPAAAPTTPPPPSVSVCCVALATQTSDLHPFGAAALTINQAEGFETLNVAGNTLPDPATFGSQYQQYAFTLTDPSTGTVIEEVLMVHTGGTGDDQDWAGALAVGVKEIPRGQVTVYPTPSGSATGPYGPAVLAGDLANCH